MVLGDRYKNELGVWWGILFVELFAMFSRLRAKTVCLGGLSAGLVIQGTCAVNPSFSTEQFLVESASTLFTDFVFFALNSALIGFV